MIDLIQHGIDLGCRKGRRWVEIPSASFVAKCEEYLQEHPTYKGSPLRQYHWNAWASVWGLSRWHFEDLGYRHPSEFDNPEARKLAYADQDHTDDPEDLREQIQTTILSTEVSDE